MKFKACVFDLDGTLINTLLSIAHFANKGLEKAGFPHEPTEAFKYYMGEGPEVLVKRLMDRFDGNAEQEQIVLKEFIEGYRENFLYKVMPYDNMKELVFTLKKKGLKLGILTNKDEPTSKLLAQTLFGAGVFDMCTGYKKGRPLKPDPTGFFEMMKAFSIEPKDCIYVGDTKTDMLLGKNAGAYTVGAAWGYRTQDELTKNGADKIAYDPLDILKEIE